MKDGETQLGCGTDVFKNCNIETLYLGRNTTEKPFATATSLSNLTIGSMVTSISSAYFSGCSAITKITSYASTPPVISENTFSNTIYSKAILNVSELSKDTYGEAIGWEKFVKIKGLSEVWPIAVSIDQTEVEIKEKSSLTLHSTVTPDNATDKSVTWSSSDETVATVDSEGNVTGVKAGTATIKVTTVSLSEAGAKLTATCKVNVVPVTATVGGIKYEVIFEGGENSSDIAKVVGGDPDEDGSVSILAEVEIDGHTYPVEEIEDAAFRDRSDITKIDIPNSIRIVKESAFYGCHTLGSVTIPASVTEIGTDAFGDCTDLSQVIIEDSRNAIDLSRPFTGCDIDYLYYGRKVTGYPAWPVTIKSLETGRYLDAFKSNEFSGFPNLYSLTIGVGMRTIDADAFKNSTITKVIWMPNTPPAGYESIKADINYVSTNNYEFENKIVSPNLSSKFMVDGLVYVFNRQAVDRTCAVIDNRYNRHIPGLDVPHKVTYSGIEFTVEEINDYALYSNQYFTTASIGDGIVSIGKYAMFNCRGIKSEPYIGKSVKTIGDYAFHNCTGMPSVTIPDATEYLGPWALSSCSSLENAKLGTGLVTIEEGCFADDSSLKQLVVPANVTTIANRVFDNCISLAYFEISDRTTTLAMGYSHHNDEYKPSDGTIGGLPTAGIPLFYYSPLKEVYIGGDISYSSSPADGYSPFYRNDALEKVVIHNNETEISDNEFYGCRGLKEVVVGNDVLRVGDYAFSGCVSIEHFTLGSKVATIGVDAFSDCDKMVEMKSYNKVPPICGDQALDDIDKFNCTLFVPETAVEDYKNAEQWKNFFHIQGMESEDIPAQEIRLSVSTVSMELGSTMQLTATVFPSDATDPVVWKSSDETIVTVSEEGLVTATGIGSAVITATCGNVYSTCCIEVLAIPAESIALSRQTAELKVNETLQLTATVAPENATDKTVVWTSSDETIVTVSAEGLLTAVGIGETTVTAKCGDVTATCAVKVTAASGIYGITIEEGKPLTVYNLQGVRLKVSTLDELNRLPKGFYIVNGKKIYIK